MDNQTMRASPILLGDNRIVMQTLDPESFHCCITSPPYWGLRDYGVPPSKWPDMSYCPMAGMPVVDIPEWTGCLGLEPTPEMFVGHIVLVYREVNRVLRSDGTIWVNFGDSYASSPSNKNDEKWGDPANTGKGGKRCRTNAPGIKPKDLIGIPWRVAFALQADGWYLRSDIIWNKPNPMPESVTDRPTKSHEYFFLLSKSQQYYYDYEAIKEPLAKSSHVRLSQDIANQKGSDRVPGKTNGSMKAVSSGITFGGKKGREYIPDKNDPNFRNGSEQWGREYVPTPDGKANKRTVWTVTTQPFSEAHFATFPEKLIEPPILAGSSPQACPHCAAPWRRVTVKTGHINKRESAHVPGNSTTKTDSTGWAHTSKGTDIFEPSCKCENNDGSAKCHVLDPFGGSGTTRKVALENNRECTTIDINPAYNEINRRRTKTIQTNLF